MRRTTAGSDVHAAFCEWSRKCGTGPGSVAPAGGSARGAGELWRWEDVLLLPVSAPTPVEAPRQRAAQQLHVRGEGVCGRAFVKRREELTAQHLAAFNQEVFGGALPRRLEVSWSTSLRTTAGMTYMRMDSSSGQVEHRARVALATKVVDNEFRLQQTLLHELCHVAAWVVDHVRKPPHGAAFRKWADRATRQYPDLAVRTCHNYEIRYKYRYECSCCGHMFGTHSKIRSKGLPKGCRRCGRGLHFLGTLDANGTPRKPRAPTAYNRFVSENYSVVKAANPEASHPEITTLLARAYKSSNARRPAAGGDRSETGLQDSG